MQDTGVLYNDFIMTIRRLYLLYLQVINQQQQESHSEINLDDINEDQILLIYYFTDDFTTQEHLIDKGLDIEQAEDEIISLIDKKYLKVQEDRILLTDKGKKVKEYFDKKFDIESRNLMYKGMMPKELSHVLALLLRFESYWLSMIKNDNNSND